MHRSTAVLVLLTVSILMSLSASALAAQEEKLEPFATAKAPAASKGKPAQKAPAQKNKPKPPAKAKPKAAAPERRSGPFVDLGCGWAFPLGDAAEVQKSGVSTTLAAGWRFPLGPGRLKLGLESGALVVSTKDDLLAYPRYRSTSVPLGALLAYDLGLFWRLRAYAQVSGGYTITSVNYDSDLIDDLGVCKPYFGAAAGLGLELAPWLGVNVGARYMRVAYDENPCSYLAPELGVELRL